MKKPPRSLRGFLGAALSGDVGANVASDGPCRASGSEVTIGIGATVEHLSRWSEGSGSANLPSGAGKRLASLGGRYSLPGGLRAGR
ncbi:MAG: hypothetical protein ACC700_19525 [Anaerolineales bacterium]